MRTVALIGPDYVGMKPSMAVEVGDWVKLGSFFDGERPVILTLNYYKCPMLCGLQLNGRVQALSAQPITDTNRATDPSIERPGVNRFTRPSWCCRA